jgi:hypothetical protein
MKVAFIRSLVGFLLGIALLPSLIACVGLYMPFFLGIDPIWGDIDIYSIIVPGYEITADDVMAIRSLADVLKIASNVGFLMGVFGLCIGLFSYYSDKKRAYQKLKANLWKAQHM